MERDKRLKRARDIEEGDDNRECHVDKKLLETIVDDEDHKESAGDAFGVFDFPWLKEGGFIAVDEFLEPHDLFSPSFDADHQPNSNVDQRYCMEQDSSSSVLLLDQDLLDYKFDVDDLDYCVWSSVIDQPLDVNICMNKA